MEQPPVSADSRRILLFLRAENLTRVLECLLVELLARGHSIHVALDIHKTVEDASSETILDRLSRTSDGRLTYGPAARKHDARADIATGLRRTLDYLRYLEPLYAASHGLRERAAERVPRISKALPYLYGDGSSRLASGIRRAIGGVERALPYASTASTAIAEHEPDIVVVSPLVEIGSPQTDYVRAARDAGIPCVYVVASWDNLTNKGMIRERPDRVIVWNEAQRDEATSLHGIDPATIEVVGAHTWDHWFTWAPSRTRDELCAELGFEPDRPLILYLGSSFFIAGDERSFVSEWVGHLRRSASPRLARAGVIVRPHPQNGAMWTNDRLASDDGVVVWPPGGLSPTDEGRKRDFFDSLHHAGAVVGINTSAMIEAAITRTPAYTIVDERFADGQVGTLHFGYLAGQEGRRLLHTATSWDEHVAQLAGAFERPDEATAGIEPFLRWFVRPQGLETPAAPLAATAVETTVGDGPRPRPGRAAAAAASALVSIQRPRRAFRSRTRVRA